MRITQIACLLIPPLLVAVTGCGSAAPDAAEVSRQMMQDHQDLGGPVTNSLGMTLVPIPAGEFEMGTAINDESIDQRYERLLEIPEVQGKLDRGDVTKDDLMGYVKKQVAKDSQQKDGPESPQHPVRITNPFYLSAFEVTQQQYEQVMGARPWEGQPLVQEGGEYAASYISWEDATEFCRRLSEQENTAYRLPTEAEWEYTCRAGTGTAYSFGDDAAQLGARAWFDKNAYHNDEQFPHRVGQKLPNWWGLYDMHGNVCEWCSDWYAPYESADEPIVDPTGPESGRQRIWRGGSFSESAMNLRSATRLSFGRQDYRPDFAAGFRVVRAFGGSTSSLANSSTASLKGSE